MSRFFPLSLAHPPLTPSIHCTPPSMNNNILFFERSLPYICAYGCPLLETRTAAGDDQPPRVVVSIFFVVGFEYEKDNTFLLIDTLFAVDQQRTFEPKGEEGGQTMTTTKSSAYYYSRSRESWCGAGVYDSGLFSLPIRGRRQRRRTMQRMWPPIRLMLLLLVLLDLIKGWYRVRKASFSLWI